MKSAAPWTDEQFKACLEDACKMKGKIGDWFKSPQGQMILNIALSILPGLLAAL